MFLFPVRFHEIVNLNPLDGSVRVQIVFMIYVGCVHKR
jgi:hypothetical protein